MSSHRRVVVARHRRRGVGVRRVARWGLVLVLAASLVVVAPAHADSRYRIRSGDTLSSIAQRFHVSVRALVVRNHIRNPNFIRAGRVLVIPSAAGTRRAVRQRRPGVPLLCQGPHGQLAVPVGSWQVSQGYAGPYPAHSGIDLAGPGGQPVRSLTHGTVVSARWWSYSYGHHVIVRSSCGSIIYAHLDRIYVRAGQTLDRGQALGTLDSTGNSTGNHLHLEIIKNGYPVNPAGYIWRTGRGGATVSGFEGRDVPAAMIKPPYDWRSGRSFAARMTRVIQVARTGHSKSSPALEVSPCLLAHARQHLQDMLGLVPDRRLDGIHELRLHRLAHIERACKVKVAGQIIARGHREPGHAVYDWLINEDESHNDTAGDVAAATLTSAFSTRRAVLDSRWRSVAVASVSHEGYRYEVVFFGSQPR